MFSQNDPYTRQIKQNCTLLIVEDMKSTREEMYKLTRDYFQTVYTAENGEEGLKLFKQHRPTLTLTDIQMPKMDGVKMAKMIKKNYKDSPIVILSAYDDKEYLFHAIETGVTTYLLKPINPELVLEKIYEISKNRMLQFLLEENHQTVLRKHNELMEKNRQLEKVLKQYTSQRKKIIEQRSRQISAEIKPDEFLTRDELHELIELEEDIITLSERIICSQKLDINILKTIGYSLHTYAEIIKKQHYFGKITESLFMLSNVLCHEKIDPENVTTLNAIDIMEKFINTFRKWRIEILQEMPENLYIYDGSLISDIESMVFRFKGEFPETEIEFF